MRRRWSSTMTLAAFFLAGVVGAAYLAQADAEKPIELSAGVFLQQNLPEGPVLSFGAHYRFKQGGPNGQYFFVVDRSHGEPAKKPVRLAKSGMLAVVVPGWKPEHAPFYGHLEDAGGREVSNTVELAGLGE